MDNKHQRKMNSERFKRFRGNKSEGQGFADKRKRKAQYEYMKILKKEKHKIKEDAAGPSNQNKVQRNSHETKPHMNRYHKQKKEFDTKKLEKDKRKHEAIRTRKEREAALEQYTKKKKANYKKLCKKTQKGQPLMRERIELLLSKIESKYNQT